MWRNVAHVTTQKVLYVLYIKQIHLKQMSRVVNYSKAELFNIYNPYSVEMPPIPF